MCETKDASKFKKIWEKQVWLWAYLFVQYCNPAVTQVSKSCLRSHKEENVLNHAGKGHQDPHAYFALHGKTMQDMRNDVQKVINNILKKELIKLFNDMDKIDNWALESVKKLYKLGIIKGDETGNYNPDKAITRQEVAVIIDRVLQIFNK